MAIPNLSPDTSQSQYVLMQGQIWSDVVNNIGKSVSDVMSQYATLQQKANSPEAKLARAKLKDQELAESNLNDLKETYVKRAVNYKAIDLKYNTGKDYLTQYGQPESNVDQIEPVDSRTIQPGSTLEPVQTQTPSTQTNQNNSPAFERGAIDFEEPPKQEPSQNLTPVKPQEQTLEPVENEEFQRSVTPLAKQSLPDQQPVSNQEQAEGKPPEGFDIESYTNQVKDSIKNMNKEEVLEALDNLDRYAALKATHRAAFGNSGFQFAPFDPTNRQMVSQHEDAEEQWKLNHGQKYIEEIYKRYQQQAPKNEDFDSWNHFKSWAIENFGTYSEMPNDPKSGIENKKMMMIFDEKRNPELNKAIREKFDFDKKFSRQEQEKILNQQKEKEKEAKLKEELGEQRYEEWKDLNQQVKNLDSQIAGRNRTLGGADLTDEALRDPEAKKRRKAILDNVKRDELSREMYSRARDMMELNPINSKTAIKIARKYIQDQPLDIDEQSMLSSVDPNIEFSQNHLSRSGSRTPGVKVKEADGSTLDNPFGAVVEEEKIVDPKSFRN